MANRKQRRKKRAMDRHAEKTPPAESAPDTPSVASADTDYQQIVHEQTVQQISHGPIPDPETLRKYNEIVPGTAERIVETWEEEVRHRRGIEDAVVTAQINDASQNRVERKRGQWFAFLITVLGFSAAVLFAYFGHPAWGTLVGGGTLATIVIAFLQSHGAKESQDQQTGSEKEAKPSNDS